MVSFDVKKAKLHLEAGIAELSVFIFPLHSDGDRKVWIKPGLPNRDRKVCTHRPPVGPPDRSVYVGHQKIVNYPDYSRSGGGGFFIGLIGVVESHSGVESPL